MSWTRRVFRFKHFLERVTSIKGASRLCFNTYGATGLLLSVIPSVKAEENSTNDFQPAEFTSLTSVHLIKNASVLTIDSATALLTQTVTALLEAEEDYADALSRLAALMQMNLQVLGNPDKCDLVWDQILNVRMQLNETKIQKQNLEMLFSCAEKILQAAAETAHLSGASYAGIAASERLESASSQVKRARKTSAKAEAELNAMEVKSIHVISSREKNSVEMREKIREQSHEENDNE